MQNIQAVVIKLIEIRDLISANYFAIMKGNQKCKLHLSKNAAKLKEKWN